MTERVQSFGGEHTRRKLDVVAKYLAAYVTIMKKQDFRLFTSTDLRDREPRCLRARLRNLRIQRSSRQPILWKARPYGPVA